MKTQLNIKTVLAILALSATALIASAQDDGQNGPPPGGGPDQGGGPGQGGGGFGGGPRHHRPLPAVIRALDVNHDGIIDSNEIANASAELLTLDKNHAGQLTFEEYLGKPPGRPRGDGEGPGGPPGGGNDGNAGGPPDGPPAGVPDENTNTPPSGGDQGGPGGPGFGGHRQRPPLPAIIRALDVNHDGIIDSNEIANASAELLTLDKNHDGQLTRDEYMGRPPGRRGGGGGPGGDGDGNGHEGPPPGQGDDGPPGAGNDGPPGAPPDGNGPPPMQQ